MIPKYLKLGKQLRFPRVLPENSWIRGVYTFFMYICFNMFNLRLIIENVIKSTRNEKMAKKRVSG